jgi:hypothetical protein
MSRRPPWTPRNGASAYGTPVGAGPKRLPGGYFRAYTPHKSEGDTPKPRKPRKVKALDYGDDEAMRRESQRAAAVRYKSARASVFSKAKPPSPKQVSYLKSLLGGVPERVAERFVEFANQLPSSSGTHLTRIHWVRAIDMAIKGSNDLCTAIDEVAISFGYSDVLEMEMGELLLPPHPL